ncbi:hypothetical protein [Paractinoplanes ferrugineus]|nr:hypothetical protein [Actinoplanes ferrugineus]
MFGGVNGFGMPGPGSGMPDAVVGAPGAEAGLAAEARLAAETARNASVSTGAESGARGGAESGAEPEPESTGRHTVPDELVQAATYRLPPDRVFRARVPGSLPPLPEDSTTRLPVPKPRQA